MKTFRNLYSKIIEWDNLYLAYHKARKGKRSRAPAASFEFYQEAYLVGLQEELMQKQYSPGKYHSFFIHEPKHRLISAAPFRDRVVHHALCNIISPIFERSFVYDSYANRVGKGTHRAIDRAQQFSRRYPFVLQVDLRQFFPSVDHAILRDILTNFRLFPTSFSFSRRQYLRLTYCFGARHRSRFIMKDGVTCSWPVLPGIYKKSLAVCGSRMG